MRKLYIVLLSYATFGFESTDGVVTRCAPIGQWMVGKSVQSIAEWVKKKHGEIRLVREINP